MQIPLTVQELSKVACVLSPGVLHQAQHTENLIAIMMELTITFVWVTKASVEFWVQSLDVNHNGLLNPRLPSLFSLAALVLQIGVLILDHIIWNMIVMPMVSRTLFVLI